MQCLQVLRKKGRSKRLYSQANIPYSQPVDNTEIEETKIEQQETEKRIHIETEVNNTVTQNNIVTLVKEVDTINADDNQVVRGDKVFEVKRYIEYNQQLSLELLLKFVNSLHEESSYKHKLTSMVC